MNYTKEIIDLDYVAGFEVREDKSINVFVKHLPSKYKIEVEVLNDTPIITAHNWIEKTINDMTKTNKTKKDDKK